MTKPRPERFIYAPDDTVEVLTPDQLAKLGIKPIPPTKTPTDQERNGR